MEKRLYQDYLRHYDLLSHGYSEIFVSMELHAVTYADAVPGGEWVVEFYSEGTEKWKSILDYVPFDFDAANKVLCQLVEHNAIMVVDERGEFMNQRQHMDNVAKDNQGAFGSGLKDDRTAYNYLLKFDSLTHFRIRNRVTEELVMGDALVCQKP